LAERVCRSFHSRLRDEFLAIEGFETLGAAKKAHSNLEGRYAYGEVQVDGDGILLAF
jgi:hypothetical protein